ncbi:MAG: hypothetical protein IJZ23_00055 [Roseburia sp.]|nr:hypothetical protein [Roseburia sp.]
MELGLERWKNIALYLRLKKEDEDIAKALEKVIDSDILEGEEKNRLLRFILERIIDSNYW